MYKTLLIVGLIGWATIAYAQFGDELLSIDLATDPDNGECLSTDGTNNTWSDTCGSEGSAFGQTWELTSTGALAPTTTREVRGNYFTATGTSPSTFPNASTTNLSIGAKLFDYLGTPGASGTLMLSTGAQTKWVATSSLGIQSSPGGSDTQVQFNDGGSFGGTSITYNADTFGAGYRGLGTPDAETPLDIALFSANSLGASRGGNIAIIPGNGSTTDSNGGSLILGDPEVGGNALVNGNGGLIQILSGYGGTSAGDGGTMYIESGSARGIGNGGNYSLLSGSGGTVGAGGFIEFIAGNGGSTSGNGGGISFTAGSAQGGDSDGGDWTATAGNSTGSGNPGSIELVAGNGIGGLSISSAGAFLRASGGDSIFINSNYSGGGFNAGLYTSSLTADRGFSLPDATGIFCLTAYCPNASFASTTLTASTTMQNATSTTFFTSIASSTNAFATNIFVSLATIGQLIVSSVLDIPSATNPTVDAEGELALQTSPAPALKVGTTTNGANFIPLATPVAFQIASSSWTATATAERTTLTFNETYRDGICWTDAGSVILRVTDGTNHSNQVTITTSTTTVNFGSNNQFNKGGEKVIFQAGTPASSPKFLYCTINRMYE